MNRRTILTSSQRLGTAFLALLLIAPTYAARDDEHMIEEIVVTGSMMRVTVGGAQDVNYVQSEIDRGRVPHPDDITSEGLLSEHDLTLSSSTACEQLFCVFTESKHATLVSRPSDELFVGIGFATNIQADTWQREPLNLIAVVDHSGSMDGAPLANVRVALKSAVKSLDANDRLGIVLYGSDAVVYLQPTEMNRDGKRQALAAISNIKSEGSTNLEAGLKLGIQLADHLNREADDRTSRIMLFTDERPNVGNTSAEGFIALTHGASHRGIGMTTIGVGTHFGAKLATKVASSRGGNLFFIDSEQAARTLFEADFDTMVSELAHDLQFSLQASPRHQITGVFGVPQDMLEWHGGGQIRFTIPSVFLSNQGGGVFVTLAPLDTLANLPPEAVNRAPLTAAITYTDARTGAPGRHAATVAPPPTAPSEPLLTAEVLVDQYQSIKRATAAHHIRNDQDAAYDAMQRIRQRMHNLPDALQKSLSDKLETTDLLYNQLAFLSGRGNESYAGTDLYGVWQVKTARQAINSDQGDLWVIGPGWAILAGDTAVRDISADDCWPASVNANTLYLEELEWVARHSLLRRGKRLKLSSDELSMTFLKVRDMPGWLEKQASQACAY